MPIYEYICDGCGKKLELLVASHSSKPTCPHCHSKKLARQISVFAAHSGGTALPCQAGSCPSSAGGCSGGPCPYSG